MREIFSFRLAKMFHLHKVTMSEEEEFDVLNAVMAFACVTCWVDTGKFHVNIYL